ncbi:MAG: AAA family ATPase [Bryobacteraceae bacterium]
MSSRIIILSGLPGSGKSTWLAENRLPSISSDEIRHLLADDATDQTIHARVFATIRYLLKHRIEIGRPVTYVDATHITPQERRPYIELTESCGCEIDALYFDVPLEVCLERNRARARLVPEEAIRDMALRLLRPSVDEGFSRVAVVTP